MTLYRIANWESLFETYETKKLAHLKWVPVPNKHDGLGFRRVAAQSNRCELFTAWNLILQIASKGKKSVDRGILQRDGRPISPDDFAMMTGFPAKIFETALLFFSGVELGWLEVVTVSEDQPPTDKTAEPPAKTAASPAQAPAEGKGMEGNGRKGSAVALVAAETDEEWRRKLQESEAYKALSVESEFEKAVFWCEQRRRQPTRRFFLGWLNKIERPMATNGHGPKPAAELKTFTAPARP